MEFEVHDRVPYPVEAVIHAMRDRIAELVPYMPDIESVKEEERTSTGPGRFKLRNRWMAKDRIPTVARSLIDPKSLGWIDHAEWDGTGVRWRLEMLFMTEYVSVTGETRFSDDGRGATLVHLKGDLKLDIAKHPSIPRLLSGTITKGVEQLVISLVKPNLLNVNRGIEKLLASDAAKGK